MLETATSFEVDGPVSPELMIGRQEEIGKIKKWAHQGRLMALTSPRRYGKTTLIGKVAADAQHGGPMVIRVDLYETASLTDLVLRLERAWARCTPDKLRPSVQDILLSSQTGLSIDGGGFALTLANRQGIDPVPALRALLDLPSQLAERERTRPLVALDEFQGVAGVPEACALIRKHAENQRGTVAYLMSGSDSGTVAGMFGTGVDGTTGGVEFIRLARLPASELTEAISHRFARVDRDVNGALDRLVAMSEGHPQRAMLLAQMLLHQLGAERCATSDHLARAITATLRHIDAEVRAIIGGLTLGQRKVVRAVAEYGTPMAARAVRTLALPKTTAQKAVPHLVATGLIEEIDREWRLNDPLLAMWIRNNYGTRA